MKMTAMNDPGPPDQSSDHEDELMDLPVVPRAGKLFDFHIIFPFRGRFSSRPTIAG